MDPVLFRTTDGSASGRLNLLSRKGPLTPKLKLIHALVRKRYDFVDRLAVALFDPCSGNLKTFVSSNVKEDPLERYEFSLPKAKSLLDTMVHGPRVINDLSVFSEGAHDHTRKIQESGFQASYTVPLLYDSAFWGFLFVNSFRKDCFSEAVVEEMDVYCQLIANAVELEIGSIRILNGALNLATDLLSVQNIGTAQRMNRMTRITRLISKELAAAGKCNFDDETIERLSRFAAFHDIGKIAVPESILMKPDGLTKQEFAVVTIHTEKGLEIIDSVLKNFDLQSTPGIDMLRNIVLSHHEKLDGSGYPHRLQGDQIPVEARIVAVADIYDALTSDRPHRSAFSSEEAFDLLQKQARRLDPDCLAALLRNRELL